MTANTPAAPLRLAVVTNIPVAYREDLFTLLGQGGVFRTRVFYCCKTPVGVPGAGGAQEGCYEREFVRGIILRGDPGSQTYLPLQLRARLSDFGPDAIVAGGSLLPSLACVAYARRRRSRVYLWWAGTVVSERCRGGLHRALRRRLFARVDGFLAYGAEAADYLRELGAVAPIVVIGNNTRDAARYAARVDAAGATDKATRVFTVLCVGQLIERKNVGGLIEAWAASGLSPEEARLEIVGSGPLEAELRARTEAAGLRGVSFVGAKKPDELPGIYAHADALVCPSLVDQWPQVVNEAMAAGLAVIVSNSAGVDWDFLSDGVTGLRFDPAAPGALGSALRLLAGDPALARRLGAAARNSAQRNDVHLAVRRIEGLVAERTIEGGEGSRP